MPDPSLTVDYLDPGFNADPYPQWARLRAEAPAWWWPEMGAWIITGYDEVRTALGDPRTSPSRRYWEHFEELPPGEGDIFRRLEDGGLFYVDRADHTRLRRLVSKAFTPKGVEDQRAFTERHIDRVLGSATAGDRFDVAADYAVAIPPPIIANLLGVEGTDAATFHHLADDVILHINPLATPAEQSRAAAAALELERLLVDAIDERRRDPRDDLLTRMLEAEDDGDRLSTSELISLVVSLVVAGSDTTVNLIALGTLALLEHPDQFQLLRERPDLLANAVEEMLRFSFVGKAVVRFASDDLVLGDTTVRAGQMLWVSVGAANRDPAVFPDPDRFDITRDTTAALSFGIGAHFCVGAALARLEGQVALRALVERFGGMQLAGDPVWKDHIVLRGLTSLPVRL